MTDTSAIELSPVPTVSDEPYISLTIHSDMHLLISPTEVARGGEHNSALFKIVKQPSSLDSFVCRAEIETNEGKTYRLVVDKEFRLTNDISVTGPGRLQLVYYSDADLILRKTEIATFHVTGSVNAVDPADPDFQDGLAQLQSAAFTAVVDPPPGGDVATFFNINGSPVAVLRFPPSAVGGDLTEARADTLYMRLSGALPMQGSLGFSGPNRGVTWEDSGRQGALYSTGSQLVMRLPEGDPPFQIEANSGSAATRSPVLTQATGDARYLTPAVADNFYLQRAGGQMQGPLITMNGGSLTNPGLAIGENSTGFYRAGSALLLSVSGALYAQYLTAPASLMMTVPLNMAANNAITNLPDAVNPQDAANRRTVESLIATAVAAAPKPNSRTYIPEGVEIPTGAGAIQFINQAFPVADNAARTIVITLFPAYTGGTPGAFYDLVYTCGLVPLVEARSAVYGTANAYMQSPIRFAATVTPVGNSIQVTLNVREISNNPNRLSQVGITASQRSYVTIEEQQN